MRKFKPESCAGAQNGVVLVLALLLLLVLTVIGVATLSSVGMQERMASNANLQALAFKAASAGITNAPEQWLDAQNWPLDSSGDTVECISGGGDWVSKWWPETPEVIELPGTPSGFSVQYQTKLGCFEDAQWPVLTGTTEDPPIQLLVLSRGVVRNPGGDVVAQREVEVRLEDRLGEPDCLVQLGSLDEDELLIPTSNFEIDATSQGGCALQASTKADAKALLGQMVAKNNTLGNYKVAPPVRVRPPRGAWGDAEQLAKAVNGLKVGLRLYNAWEMADPSVTNGDPNPFQSCQGTLIQGDSGCPTTGGITYISGDLTAGGSCTAGGTMIVEGGWITNGTPSYSGNVLILGGNFSVKGFGSADNVGLLVVQNLFEPKPGTVGSADPAYDLTEVSLKASRFNVKGGGGAKITPQDCTITQNEWQLLNDCLDGLRTLAGQELIDYADLVEDPRGATLEEADLKFGSDNEPVLFPIPDCDGSGSGRIKAIASWREFIDQYRWTRDDVTEYSW